MLRIPIVRLMLLIPFCRRRSSSEDQLCQAGIFQPGALTVHRRCGNRPRDDDLGAVVVFGAHLRSIALAGAPAAPRNSTPLALPRAGAR